MNKIFIGIFKCFCRYYKHNVQIYVDKILKAKIFHKCFVTILYFYERYLFNSYANVNIQLCLILFLFFYLSIFERLIL
jgi:hypothetical protein